MISFPGQKNNKYKFICIVQRISVVEDIEVMGLKSCDESNILFKTDENDVSTFNSLKILANLPEPSIVSTAGRFCYKFDRPVDIGKLK